MTNQEVAMWLFLYASRNEGLNGRWNKASCVIDHDFMTIEEWLRPALLRGILGGTKSVRVPLVSITVIIDATEPHVNASKSRFLSAWWAVFRVPGIQTCSFFILRSYFVQQDATVNPVIPVFFMICTFILSLIDLA